MKSLPLTTCILALLSSFAAHAGNLVINGDFEEGEGTAFYQTPGWQNLGKGQNPGTVARTDKDSVISGTYSAVINDRYNSVIGEYGPITHVQKTEYIIQEGDSFTVAYDWTPADEFWQTGADTVRFVLYATANDKAAGTMIWSSELTSDFLRGQHTKIKKVFEVSEVVDSDAVGRPLFVMFYGVDTEFNETGSAHWARVDNIEVRVADAQ